MRINWKGSALTTLAAGLIGLSIACGSTGGGSSATSTPAASGGTTTAATAAAGIAANIGKDDKASITGAGATFPAAIYQAWFDEYNKSVAKGVQINYQSIGSGGGIQQFTEKTVEFGASDAPMSNEELAKAPDAVHVPTVIGSVVMAYNLPGVTKLQLDADTISAIYLGNIKKWNDPKIAALNSGVKLPDADIQVAYRSDGSGTTFVFTDYLTNVSTDWKTKVGTSKNPNWPVGQGGKGNEGVANVVKQTVNSIGYIELQYSMTNKISFADVKNKSGKFVTASIAATAAAAVGSTLPPDYRGSIVNADGADAYPIASFTYLLIHKDTASCDKQAPLVRTMWWMYHDKTAQKLASELFFAPLPEAVAARVDTTLKSFTCGGKAILPAS
ncbi:MAG: phosphate ABC transporter substrate-binding protein PstS [Chloroflexota bacterium]